MQPSPNAEIERRLFEALRDFLVSKGYEINPGDSVIIPLRFQEQIEIPVELIFAKRKA